MHYAVIARILGILLMLFSLTMLPPILVSILYADGATQAFITAMIAIFGIGFIAWLPMRQVRQDLRTRDGFLIAALFWLALGIAGTLPLMLITQSGLSFADAFFETTSGLSTTGATVITGLDLLPKSILWYRQQLQWLGGMGVVVLAVAIFPMLGIGGMQLYKAEAPGPIKDSKLTPRIAETAKSLWYVYLFLTVACALAFWLAGMDTFDAISHSFATVATGGFSTHDASFGYFDSPLIEAICVVFMLLASFNFALHFYAWRNRSLSPYRSNGELLFFLRTLALVGGIIVLTLWLTDTYSLLDATRYGLFELVSIVTSTGFGIADFSVWPMFVPFLLFIVAFMGGCAGSTTGGLKVIRTQLLFAQAAHEIRRLIYPNAVLQVKLGKQVISGKVLSSVWGFLAVYGLTAVVISLLLMAMGLDQVSAVSAAGFCLNNTGVGMGTVAANYASISDGAKWLLGFTMLLGRLEIFTFLVLLTPSFWRG